jgi:hypothetical protein
MEIRCDFPDVCHEAALLGGLLVGAGLCLLHLFVISSSQHINQSESKN